MSWKETIENTRFSITTGDGKTYYPKWKNGEKETEYNIKSYDFINVKYSFVTRKMPKSSKYPLVFWFDGEDYLIDAKAFEISAEDSRIWTVIHPLYGTLKGYPASLKRSDAHLNITEIAIDFWESIVKDYPKTTRSVKDESLELRSGVLDYSIMSYMNDAAPVSGNITSMEDSNNQTANSFFDLLGDADNSEYLNAFYNANKATDKLLIDANDAIYKSQVLLTLPSDYEIAVKAKILAYKNAFNNLISVFDNVADKLFYESQGGALIACMCYSAVNPLLDSDYDTRNEVNDIFELIIDVYENYLQLLDVQQVNIYNVGNSYSPNVDLQIALANIVSFCLGNLYDFVFDAMQERIVYVEKDTNIILLVHRYLGGDDFDEKLDNFRELNNLALNELFRIKKDREIKYYV